MFPEAHYFSDGWFTRKWRTNKMQGLKSQVKQFLKSHGVTTINLDSGSTVKIQRAKTSQLIKRASKFADFK